jgi:hypothetical protein
MSGCETREWRDAQLMALGGGFYSRGLPGLRFVVPSACAPKGKGGDDEKTPGIYLIENMPSSGPVLGPKHAGRLLTRDEALEYARAVDKICRPKPYERKGSMFAKDVEDDHYPPTYAVLVEAWYECLGRMLGKAIKVSEDRRTELREVRAALTGEVTP